MTCVWQLATYACRYSLRRLALHPTCVQGSTGKCIIVNRPHRLAIYNMGKSILAQVFEYFSKMPVERGRYERTGGLLYSPPAAPIMRGGGVRPRPAL